MSVFRHLEGGSKLLQDSTEVSIQRALVKFELCSRQELGQLVGRISWMQSVSNPVTDIVRLLVVNRISVKLLGHPVLLTTFPVFGDFLTLYICLLKSKARNGLSQIPLNRVKACFFHPDAPMLGYSQEASDAGTQVSREVHSGQGRDRDIQYPEAAMGEFLVETHDVYCCYWDLWLL